MRTLLLLLLFTPACQGGGPAADEAPGFTVTDADGQPLSLSDLRGRVVLLDFWATWCPPCRAEVPDLVETNRRFAPRGLAIVGISLDRDMDTARRFIRDNRMEWTHVLDKQAAASLADTYRVEYIPETFLIDGKGAMVARGLRGAQLREKIAALLDR